MTMPTDMIELARNVAAGDRRALARAITLVESGRANHRSDAMTLLDLLAFDGKQAICIGLSGLSLIHI